MEEPAEKVGLRNAWGRVARAYEEMWADRTAPFTARGLDLLDAPRAGRGLDVGCGPGLTAAALADRLDGGVLGVDFAPAMAGLASERFAGRDDLAFAVDDAENLSLAEASFDAVTCSFGLMYCYDAQRALGHMARVLRPGGRLLSVVWGRAKNVWWVPVIELVETRAEYFSSVCPLIFFYGLPGVMSRMVDQAGLELVATETIDGSMEFADPDEAVEAAIQGGPLAGLFNNRLDADAQDEVRELLAAHVRSLSTPVPGGIRLPAEISITVAARPTS